MPSRTTEELTIKSSYTDIYSQCHRPKEVRAVVVLVHGFGEHSGRYGEKVIPALLDCGLAVVTYDNIGHGKSGGKKGHCPSYKALMDILQEVIAKAEVLFPDRSHFLYGHSMGGNLVLNYALRRKNKIAGIVATSPYLRLAYEPPKWKMVLGKLLLKIYPSLTMPSGLDASGISRIPEEVGKYEKDLLNHDMVSPMFSFPIMNAGQSAIDSAGDLEVDTLLLHGSGDRIIDYRGTEEFHKNSSKTELKVYQGGFHELHYDLCSQEMLQDVQNWFRQRV